MPNYALCNVRTLLAIAIFFFFSAIAYSQVDESEFRNLPPVNFINYEGPQARIDSREEIRQIGVALGQTISARERALAPTLAGMSAESRRTYSYQFEAGAQNRYFVTHSISGPDSNKLDADIFSLGAGAGVDHIRNLRTIIQGYLQAAYNYNASDAALLAEFITIYNAVYRGNWDYITNRYKADVISYISRDRVGLSTRYDEWPGRTLMLIPLGHGGLSSIDTSTISDSRVIEEMRRGDDQGVPQRQDLVNLLEREAEQAEQQAQTERQAIRQEEAQIAQERQQTAQERQQIEQERQQTQEDQQAGRITQEEARRTEQELGRREGAVQQREQGLEKREEDLDQRRDEVQRLEDFAEQKTEEAQRQREDIARDQQAAIAGETARDQQAAAGAGASGGVFGITIESQDPVSMGRLVRFIPATGRELRRSPLNLIHTRTVTFLGGRIFAIAGENRGNSAVRLVEINQDSLEMTRQGNDDIKAGSLLWVNGNDLYAITVNLANNSCNIGRFDVNLALQAKSAVTVHQGAAVTIQQGRLLTQREDGSILILNPADLTEAR
jgi:hypothetical protein